jgi:hypothetical protein
MFRSTAHTPATYCLDSLQNSNDREVVTRARRLQQYDVALTRDNTIVHCNYNNTKLLKY